MQASQLNVGDLIEVIKYPLVTEKSTKLNDKNAYTFIVDKKVTKPIIKAAIEYIFDVQVVKVNTINLPLKERRLGKFSGYKPNYKKTIVTLAADNRIELFPNSSI